MYSAVGRPPPVPGRRLGLLVLAGPGLAGAGGRVSAAPLQALGYGLNDARVEVRRPARPIPPYPAPPRPAPPPLCSVTYHKLASLFWILGSAPQVSGSSVRCENSWQSSAGQGEAGRAVPRPLNSELNNLVWCLVASGVVVLRGGPGPTPASTKTCGGGDRG
ncbi:hypothetical protein E2C01_040096 [Portunus trituberculatus]|uniref:Uncharacterized protein n=1 Tax=Portunus trituberculatus TaxID=210409 RepID=A0A5B7FLJ4_PORTR|nr:hypothetical protein [Portunus trituberculatus]